MRDEDSAARVAQQVSELHACLGNGDADAAITWIHGDDAHLWHAIFSERSEHALGVVVDELLDLGGQLLNERHGETPVRKVSPGCGGGQTVSKRYCSEARRGESQRRPLGIYPSAGRSSQAPLRALPPPPPALQVQAALHCPPPDAGAHRRGCRAALGAREE